MANDFIWFSHFSGCGGSSLGARIAGITPILGIEYDPAIASLYSANVGDVLVKDITQVDPKKLDIPALRDRSNSILVLQTSPECKKFSRANAAARANYEESMQSKSANLIRYTYSHYELFRPEYVVLENVIDYRHTHIHREFEEFLISLKYRIFKGVFNAADYGVPQTRERFIMIAARDDYPIPQVLPTHSRVKEGQLSLFSEVTKKWVGWYESIADLIPSLPESRLTKKQAILFQERKEIPHALLIERIGYYDLPKIAKSGDPIWTLRSHLGRDGKEKEGNRNKIIDAVLSNDDVRSLSIQALARLQGFPDSYQWTSKASTDIKGIGNSIPPLFMQKICESIKSLF